MIEFYFEPKKVQAGEAGKTILLKVERLRETPGNMPAPISGSRFPGIDLQGSAIPPAILLE